MTESPFSDDAFGFILRELDVRGLALSGCCCKNWQAHVARISAEPQFHAAMSRADNLQEAVNEVFEYCCRFSFRPNVAFVFLSDDMLEDGEVQVSAIFTKALAKLPTDLCLIGCTGVGLVGMDINSRQVLEVETTIDQKTREPKAASGVSLALAKIPAATVHATVVRNKKDSDAALEVLQAQYPTETSASSSMRAMILANVKKHADQVLLTTLIQEVDAMWPSSEVTGGLASAKDPHASTLICRPPRVEQVLVSNKGGSVLLTMAAQQSGATAEATALTHATVARNVVAVGPVMRVVESESTTRGLRISKIAVRSGSGSGMRGAGEGEEEEHEARSFLLKLTDEFAGEEDRIVCGISWQENPNDSQLQIFEITALQKGAILLQALPDACAQPLDAPPHALPDACVPPPAPSMTMRFMRPCHSGEEMERVLHDTMRWTEAYLQTRPGFANRLVDGGRAQVASCVRGALMFACCGRGQELYGKANVDSGALHASFPSSRALCGFFCNGEIGPAYLGSTRTEIHGFTTVYTLFEGV